jgi:protein-S-isoprenylcysteine O-methyltransferase Ste14
VCCHWSAFHRDPRWSTPARFFPLRRFTQIARIYLGRRFGLLPANRGIVSGGPFRWMRHPIYSGWVILTIGFLMAYPNRYNVLMFAISLPFLVWRMSLEEQHLTEDPEYCAYLAKTPYRLFPGIY